MGFKISKITKLSFFIFFFVLIILVLYSLSFAKKMNLQGDEPHYLIITQSILSDHDIDLINNYQNKDWAKFYLGQLPDTHISINSPQGHGYSVHGVGLPLLVLPGFALGGKLGAILIINLIAGLLAVNIFLLALEMTKKEKIALLVSILIALTLPLFSFSFVIYTELPTALLLIYSLRKIRNLKQEKPINLALASLAVAFLPWLHTNNLLLVLILVGLMFWQSWDHLKKFLIYFIPILVSILGLSFYFYHYFGSFWFGAGVTGMVSFSAGWRGILGLLFDQEYGLFIYTPFYLLAFPGLIILAAKKKFDFIYIMPPFLVIWIFNGLFFEWWAGWSPPTRYLVTVVPLLAPALVYTFSLIKNVFWFIIAGFLSLISLLVTYVIAKIPALLYNFADGKSELLTKLGPKFDINLTSWFPSLILARKRDIILLLVLLVFIFVAQKLFFSSQKINLKELNER
jgi:hypothetical protein